MHKPYKMTLKTTDEEGRITRSVVYTSARNIENAKRRTKKRLPDSEIIGASKA